MQSPGPVTLSIVSFHLMFAGSVRHWNLKATSAGFDTNALASNSPIEDNVRCQQLTRFLVPPYI